MSRLARKIAVEAGAYEGRSLNRDVDLRGRRPELVAQRKPCLAVDDDAARSPLVQEPSDCGDGRVVVWRVPFHGLATAYVRSHGGSNEAPRSYVVSVDRCLLLGEIVPVLVWNLEGPAFDAWTS